MLSNMLTDQIEILSGPLDVKDDFGNPTGSWVVSATAAALVEVRSGSEDRDGRETHQIQPRVFLVASAPVDLANRVRWRGADYHITGIDYQWHPRRAQVDHLVVSIERVA